jgi:SAM-dependent methyltransferase
MARSLRTLVASVVGRLTGRGTARGREREARRARRRRQGGPTATGAGSAAGGGHGGGGGWRRQARLLGAEIVPLAEVDGSSMELAGRHTESDIARYAHVLTRVKGSLLDVGCGHGIFLDGYEGTDKAGVDIQARGEHPWPFHLADAGALPFADRSWDTVSAQEMLEHQADGKIETVLAELRRVARERLLITVPFCERRLRTGHVQRFDAARVRSMFPDARYAILDKGGRAYQWILIEEDRSALPSALAAMPVER